MHFPKIFPFNASWRYTFEEEKEENKEHLQKISTGAEVFSPILFDPTYNKCTRGNRCIHWQGLVWSQKDVSHSDHKNRWTSIRISKYHNIGLGEGDAL